MRVAVHNQLTPELAQRLSTMGYGARTRQPHTILVIWPDAVAAALWSPISLVITISVVAPVIVGSTPFLNTTGQLVIYWILVALSVIAWALQDHSAFDKKRAEIAGLRSTFRKRFPRSELLSMYECLKSAPDVFWQDYKKLPDVQISETTNNKFRERTAPYANWGSNVVQRRALLIAGAAALVAILTFVEASLDGGSVEWVVRELFGWSQQN